MLANELCGIEFTRICVRDQNKYAESSIYSLVISCFSRSLLACVCNAKCHAMIIVPKKPLNMKFSRQIRDGNSSNSTFHTKYCHKHRVKYDSGVNFPLNSRAATYRVYHRYQCAHGRLTKFTHTHTHTDVYHKLATSWVVSKIKLPRNDNKQLSFASDTHTKTHSTPQTHNPMAPFTNFFIVKFESSKQCAERVC